MSQFLSNKYLRYRGLDQRPARFIDSDRPCHRCDYNLRGLLNTSVCPECGTAIKVEEPARFALLADAPLADIRRLYTGLWLAIACIVATPLALIFATATAVQVGRPIWTSVWAVLLLLSAMWVAAVWFMTPVLETPDGRKYGFSTGSKLRHAARWSQLGWPLAVILAEFGPPSIWFGLCLLALVTIGLGGLVALALMLGRLADWSCDEPAGRLLNITVWLLPLSTAILLLAPVLTVLRSAICIALVMWTSALATMGLALLSLALSATWSIKHAKDRSNKDKQLRERIVRRPPPPPRSDEPIPLARPGDPLPQVGLVDGDSQLRSHQLDEIERDAYCTSCGYNVRGLKVYGRCPECGERIASA